MILTAVATTMVVVAMVGDTIVIAMMMRARRRRSCHRRWRKTREQERYNNQKLGDDQIRNIRSQNQLQENA
jgi:hypothetical protein